MSALGISGQTAPGENPTLSGLRTLATAMFQMEQTGLDQFHRIPKRVFGYITVQCRRADVLMPHELLDCPHSNAFRIQTRGKCTTTRMRRCPNAGDFVDLLEKH